MYQSYRSFTSRGALVRIVTVVGVGEFSIEFCPKSISGYHPQTQKMKPKEPHTNLLQAADVKSSAKPVMSPPRTIIGAKTLVSRLD